MFSGMFSSGLEEETEKYRQEYSSSFIWAVQAAFLEPFDWLFTFFYRWPLIFFRDIFLKNPDTAAHASFGPLVWFAEHPFTTETGVAAIAFLGLAKACGFWTETEYQNEIKRQVHQEQCEEKRIIIQEKLDSLRKQFTFDNDDLIKSLNERLQNPREDDENEKKFFARFKNARIDVDENGTPFVKMQTQFNPERFLLAIWMTLFLSAFYFWIGWIIEVSLTASLANGMPGCSFFVSYILPLAVSALTFMGFKTWHWFDHRHSNGQIKNSEEAYHEASLLEYLLNDELKKNWLKHEDLSFESTPKPENAKELAFYAGGVGFLSGFLQAQYVLWLTSAAVMDYLHFTADLAGTVFANDFGIGSVIAACGFAYKAYHDKLGALEEHVDLKINLNNVPDLDGEIDKLKGDISGLKTQLNEKNWMNQNALSYFFERLGKKEFEFFNHIYYKMLCDFTMSSVFVARVFLLPNTSPFMPACFHMAAIAASLSNPVTWTLLFLTAVGWSAYRYHARAKEAQFTAEKEASPKAKKEEYLALAKEKEILVKRVNKNEKASRFSSERLSEGLSKLGLFGRCLLPAPAEVSRDTVYLNRYAVR